jgi:hypothetical protein
LQGLRATPALPKLLPIAPVSPTTMDEVLMSAWNQRRA